MSETLQRAEQAVETIIGVPDEDVPHFLRDSIAERRLSDLMRSLNEAVTTGDPSLRDSAERALRHLGFL